MDRFPSWTFASSSIDDKESSAFKLGVALQALKGAYDQEAPGWGCWIDRLCLEAASAICALEGRPSTQIELRDALHVSGSQDPGPSGRIYRFMRQVYRDRSGVDEAVIVRELERVGVVVDERVDEIIETGLGSLPLPRQPLLSRLEALFARSRRLRPDMVLLPLTLADLALAREIRGPLIPLSAMSVSMIWKREATLLAEFPTRACLAAGQAFHAKYVAMKAALKLRESMGSIRTKNRSSAFNVIEANDVVTASELSEVMTERAARRMLERLETTGMIKEYSGRKYFKYYGL